jgi:hypothetical protein
LRDGNLFEETEKARAEEGADGCGSDDEPAIIVRKEVAAAVTRPSVDGIAYRVGEGLEDGVEPGVRGEGHLRSIVCGMNHGLARLNALASCKVRRAQPVDATLACSLLAGVSKPKVFRGR